jgi:hypothetical protein
MVSGTGRLPPAPSPLRAHPEEPRRARWGSSIFGLAAEGSVPIPAVFLLKPRRCGFAAAAVAGELHPVPGHRTAQGRVGCGVAEDEAPAFAFPCAHDGPWSAVSAARCVAHPMRFRSGERWREITNLWPLLASPAVIFLFKRTAAEAVRLRPMSRQQLFWRPFCDLPIGAPGGDAPGLSCIAHRLDRPRAVGGLRRENRMTDAEVFKCPNCNSKYRLVRVEAEPDASHGRIECRHCGGPAEWQGGSVHSEIF